MRKSSWFSEGWLLWKVLFNHPYMLIMSRLKDEPFVRRPAHLLGNARLACSIWTAAAALSPCKVPLCLFSHTFNHVIGLAQCAQNLISCCFQFWTATTPEVIKPKLSSNPLKFHVWEGFSFSVHSSSTCNKVTDATEQRNAAAAE